MRDLIFNERIRAREVRVIDEKGAPLGVLDLRRAITTAQERGLDLILISPNAQPPVCRIGEKGKYKYELTKREKEARKSQKSGLLKEIKLSPQIAAHDFEVRLAKTKELLTKGFKVKVTIYFRGRQVAHPDFGKKVMAQMVEALGSLCRVEFPPRLEGKLMTMLLVPGGQPASTRGEHA